MEQIGLDNNIEEIFFVGEYEHTLDKQRRIAIPSCWRKKDIPSRFIILPGRDNKLQVMPYEHFQDFIKKAKQVSFANAKKRLALAQMGSKAHDCTCDKQGRIQIPLRLIDYASLKCDKNEPVVLVGAFDEIQVMTKATWDTLQIADENCLDLIQEIEED